MTVKAFGTWKGDEEQILAMIRSALVAPTYKHVTESGTYVVVADDVTLFCDPSSGEQTIMLPHAADFPGRTVSVAVIADPAPDSDYGFRVQSLDGDIISSNDISGSGMGSQGIGCIVQSDGISAWWCTGANF